MDVTSAALEMTSKCVAVGMKGRKVILKQDSKADLNEKYVKIS